MNSSSLPIKVSHNNITKAYVVLGHEILFPSHDLSTSSRLRCELLRSSISFESQTEVLVVFMGQGRLQGDCNLTISECMYKYYNKNYGRILNVILDKRSKDTVGDAVLSSVILSTFPLIGSVRVVTSDWHVKRASSIFRKVYSLKSLEVSFMGSVEACSMQSIGRQKLLVSEELSLAVFCKTFPEESYCQPWDKLLADRHPLYRGL